MCTIKWSYLASIWIIIFQFCQVLLSPCNNMFKSCNIPLQFYFYVLSNFYYMNFFLSNRTLVNKGEIIFALYPKMGHQTTSHVKGLGRKWTKCDKGWWGVLNFVTIHFKHKDDTFCTATIRKLQFLASTLVKFSFIHRWQSKPDIG